MSSDYNQIRESNIEEYGKGTRHLAFLGKLYTDRTHFIFELLQNADDARATRVQFDLRKDSLRVRHDGRPFVERDVRGVCGVGEGTKVEDLTKIGKFGVGFKSVYSYTCTPHIHSGEEHFRIQSFVRPYVEPALKGDPKAPWTTLFVFPFDQPDVKPAKAFTEIENALQHLDPRTLLFLRSVERIEWEMDGRKGGYRSRQTKAAPRGLAGERCLAIGDTDEAERWLIFERPVQPPGEKVSVRVEIALKLGRDSKGRTCVEPMEESESPLVVFFPTEKETHLGFLIQGPYRTTPARDNIPKDDEWNVHLVEATARLLIDVLGRLKKADLLSIEVLNALPIRPEAFPEESMFHPVYDAVRDALSERPLLPDDKDGYVAGKRAMLARGKGLRELLNDEQLQQLLGRDAAPRWLSPDITEAKTPELYQYVMEELGVEELTPEGMVDYLDEDFLKQQSDKWFIRFYAFLHDQEALWRQPRWDYDPPGPLRAKPFVRTEVGEHVAPFNYAKEPQVFLPGQVAGSFPEVARAIARDETARKLLMRLGLSEPNLYDEVVQQILPRYQDEDCDVSPQQNHEDVLKIAGAFSAAGDKRHRLHYELLQTSFLFAKNAANGEEGFEAPPNTYRRTDELEAFFSGNEEIWFLEPYPADCRKFLDLLIPDKVLVTRRNPEQYSTDVILSNSHGWHVKGENGFDPRWKIDGLDHALENPTEARARYLWNNILVVNANLIEGVTLSSTRKDFANAKREQKVSAVGQQLIEHAWLPQADGKFCRPSEIATEDLPAEYQRCPVLEAALKMKRGFSEGSTLVDFARATGIPEKLLLFACKHDEQDLLTFMAEFEARTARRHGASSPRANGKHDAGDDRDAVEPGGDDVDETKRRNDTASNPSSEEGDSDDAEQDSASFPSLLQQAFSKPPCATASTEHGGTRSELRDAQRRRERVSDEIREQQTAEPPAEVRFVKVPRKVWENPAGTARQFLIEEYGGHCQVCNSTFAKRDGTPYFEGVYLVSRTHARWVDRPGNVICLCASCSAKVQYGAVEAEDVLEQILTAPLKSDASAEGARLDITLCGDRETIRYSDRHMIDLQELLSVALDR